VNAMGELDKDSWIEAARYLAWAHRRLWQCQLGTVAAFFSIILYLPFAHKLNPYWFGVPVLAFVAIGVVGNAALEKLLRFRCPRCGKEFLSGFRYRIYKKQCKHCGLDLSPAGIDKASPFEGGGLWE
jgi:ribosomal protein L37E